MRAVGIRSPGGTQAQTPCKVWNKMKMFIWLGMSPGQPRGLRVTAAASMEEGLSMQTKSAAADLLSRGPHADGDVRLRAADRAPRVLAVWGGGAVPIAAGLWLNLAADRAFENLGDHGQAVRALVGSGDRGRVSGEPQPECTSGTGFFDPHRCRDTARRALAAPRRGQISQAFAETRFIPAEERMLAETFGKAWASCVGVVSVSKQGREFSFSEAHRFGIGSAP